MLILGMQQQRDLVRGSEGEWVVVYGKNIGVSSVLDAELQAIADGLKTVGNKRVRLLLIECDCKIKTVVADLKLGL